MAKQKSAAREPMLYITQPDFQKAKPRMQSTYRSVPETKAKKSQEKEAPNANEEKTAAAPKKERTRNWERRNQFGLNTPKTETEEFKQQNPFDVQKQESPTEEPEAVEEESVDEAVEEEAEENKEDERPRVSFGGRKRRERFKDMSLEERIDYFVHLPSSVPRMKCEVTTDGERSYRGWIQDYQDGIVTMKILQRPFRVEIPFDSIESIELRGF